MTALDHLRNVLMILADLHSDDQCQAYKDALAFYNQACPAQRIEPHDGYSTRLVHTTPIDECTSPLKVQPDGSLICPKCGLVVKR